MIGEKMVDLYHGVGGGTGGGYYLVVFFHLRFCLLFSHVMSHFLSE